LNNVSETLIFIEATFFGLTPRKKDQSRNLQISNNM